MEQTECSETSARKIQVPGNYPEESIQQIDTCPYYQFVHVIFHAVSHLTWN